MNDILAKIIEDDFELDYQRHINILSKKHKYLKKWASSDVHLSPDPVITEALETIFKTCSYINKESILQKESGLIFNVALKALKIAQGILAVLLLKDPIRVGIAYTALHSVIKTLQKDKNDKELKKVKKK